MARHRRTDRAMPKAPAAPEADKAPVTLEAGKAPAAPEAGKAPVTLEAGKAPAAPEAGKAPATLEADKTVKKTVKKASKKAVKKAAKKTKTKPKALRVAPGKSITTKTGVKTEGDKITEREMAKETVKNLLDKGYLVVS